MRTTFRTIFGLVLATSVLEDSFAAGAERNATLDSDKKPEIHLIYAPRSLTTLLLKACAEHGDIQALNDPFFQLTCTSMHPSMRKTSMKLLSLLTIKSLKKLESIQKKK